MTPRGENAADQTASGDGNEETTDGIDGGELLELGIITASAIIVTVILAYVLWQAAVTPETVDPVATVGDVELRINESNQTVLRVPVHLENRGEVGLVSVEVTVRCGDKIRELQFANVPAQGTRSGTVVCPAGASPRATVTSWVTA